MPMIRTYGRTTAGGGHQHPAGQARTSGQQSGVTYPLAQTLPSVAPRPRFRPPQISPVPRPYTAPGMSGAGPWRGGDNTNDALIHRTRHGYFDTGQAKSGTTWEPGASNVLNAGPVRPDLGLINITWNWQTGTGAAYADDPTRGQPIANAGTKRLFMGEQGSGWTTVNGGAPGFYRQGPGGTPVGDPNTGPGRVWGGPPHGYHTLYPPDRLQTQRTQTARPQMRPARVDRLSNSRIAGQTYSQWTQHQGGGQQ